VTSPRLDDERENRVRAELLERHRSDRIEEWALF
jgi:hypothetical protein